MSSNFTIPSQYNPTINRKIQCAALDANAFENYITSSKFPIYRIMSIRDIVSSIETRTFPFDV